MIKEKVNIKTIIVVLIIILVIVLGVLAVNTVRTYVSGAASGSEPKNVSAVPSEDGKSAIVSWSSDKPSIGVVEYGTTPASLLLRAVETDPITDHRVSLSPLKQGVSYYYRIRVGDDIFDNNGIPYLFKVPAGKTADVSPAPVNNDQESNPVPQVTLIPTIPVNSPVSTPSSLIPTPTVSGVCNRTTDYDKDGVINSLDYLNCMKTGTSPASTSSAVTPTPASGSSCKLDVDYDNNGVINSLDRLKCLQNNR